MDSLQERYGAGQFRRSLMHFFVSKGIGALIGLAWLFLLVRALASSDYGAYFTLYAYIELMIVASACGLMQILERFVPELHDRHADRQVVSLSARLLIGRATLLLVFAALGQLFWSSLGPLIGVTLSAESWLFVHGILLVEGTCRTIDAYHDALLNQRRAQMSVLIRNGIKVLVLAVLMLDHEHVSLELWLRLEFAALCIALLASLLFVTKTQRQLSRAQTLSQRLDWRRYASYGLYMQAYSLLWLLTSMDMVRLLVGRLYGLETAALFGFSLALALMIQRYLPTYLLIGMVRPLFIVAAQRSDRSVRLAGLLRLFIKLNALLLLPLLLISVWHEDELLSFLSGGKFHDGSGLLALLVGLLVLQALKSCQSLALVALEDGKGELLAAAAAAVVLLLGVLVGHHWGVQALVLAIYAAEVTVLGIQYARIRWRGMRFVLPWSAVSWLLLANSAVLLAMPLLMRDWGPSSSSRIFLDIAACAIASVFVLARYGLDAFDKDALRSVVPKRLSRWLPGSVRS